MKIKPVASSQSPVGSKEIRASNLREFAALAKKFAAGLKGGEVIALSGPLGAGKTTFVQIVGRALGVRERITSPTFTLMHVHPARGRNKIKLVAHLDAYRLRGAKAFREIGALDYLGRPDTVAFVEWAEKVRRALPRETRWIKIELNGEERKIIF